MANNHKIGQAFENIESGSQEKIKNALRDVIKEVNSTLEKVINLTITHSDNLEECIRKDLTSLKMFIRIVST